MNLDKFIRIQLLTLSQNYDISIIEITHVKDGKIGKNYTVNLKNKQDDESTKEWFSNKRDLVSWLLCLK